MAARAEVAGPSWVPRRMSHLRRDRRGLPVPYINHWGPERLDRMSIRPDVTVRMNAVFWDDEGETEPDFTQQNIQRQRECMAYGLCQVCARQVPWSRRFLVVSSISVETIEVEGLGERVSLTEPWLDEECARVAIEHCPGLIRRHRDEDLQVAKITSARQVQMVASTGWLDGPLEAQTRADPVAMWIKLLLPPGMLRVARRGT